MTPATTHTAAGDRMTSPDPHNAPIRGTVAIGETACYPAPMSNTADLRQRLRAIQRRCNNPNERRNEDGTFNVDGRSWIATRELVQLATELDNALFKLEELEKRDGEFVTIKRETME